MDSDYYQEQTLPANGDLERKGFNAFYETLFVFSHIFSVLL